MKFIYLEVIFASNHFKLIFTGIGMECTILYPYNSLCWVNKLAVFLVNLSIFEGCNKFRVKTWYWKIMFFDKKVQIDKKKSIKLKVKASFKWCEHVTVVCITIVRLWDTTDIRQINTMQISLGQPNIFTKIGQTLHSLTASCVCFWTFLIFEVTQKETKLVTNHAVRWGIHYNLSILSFSETWDTLSGTIITSIF